MHVDASLKVHSMEIEAGKKAIRELGNGVSKSNRNYLESTGEIETQTGLRVGNIKTVNSLFE